MNIHVDSPLDDAGRRGALYRGDLFVLPASPAAVAIAALAQEMLVEAFAPHDPPVAQYHMPVEEYAAILSDLKPRFIHHPRCKELIPLMLSEAGCDVD